jgi:hypothetical protein
MTGGGSKKTAGFTKQAQQQKYIRKRDVKQKESELKKENNICNQMIINICNPCKVKLQWRFRFDKYKPLTRPGNCQECKQKNITKAYRTYCDACAAKKHVCPGCCKDIDEANRDHSPSTDVNRTIIEDDSHMKTDSDDTNQIHNPTEEGSDGPSVAVMEVSIVNAMAVFNPPKDDESMFDYSGPNYEDENRDDDDDNENEDIDDDVEESSTGVDNACRDDASVFSISDTHTVSSSSVLTRELNEFGLVASKLSDAITTWDERKYRNMALSKYSKSRVMGGKHEGSGV